MRSVVTTMSDSWAPLAEIVLPNMFAYCSKNGYGTEVRMIPPSFEFHKIEMILSTLEKSNVVFCLDLDTLITNHNIKFEEFLDAEHDFYITQDINTWNVGSVIIKNTDWARSWMETILKNEEGHENEQTAIMKYMANSRDKIKVLPHPSINSYPYDEYAPTYGLIEGWEPTTGSRGKPTHEQGDWQPGDFIAHLPGLPVSRRIEIFNKMKDQIIL